jgi:hypothetical protein
MEYPKFSGSTIQDKVKRFSIRQDLLNYIITLRLTERKNIDDCTMSIPKEFNPLSTDQPPWSTEAVKSLSAGAVKALTNKKLSEIFTLNNDLRSKAEACLQEFRWSIYSVNPDDIKKGIESWYKHWYTAHSIVALIGVPIGIAVVFLIIYILKS